ncbi:MAG: DUF721 domain-containing protein [Gammaproteobacteria bacterium]|nr:MAG: DUF721 domain-containing protein [Gammaproteobacteria bacterium]
MSSIACIARVLDSRLETPMVDAPDPESGPTGLSDRLRPGNTVLGRVVRHAQRLLRIERALHEMLPVALRNHVVVAALDSGRLRLLVSGSARATQLRFQQRLIQTQLTERTGEPVQRVDVVVRPQAAEPPARQLDRSTTLPARAAAQFQDMANDEPDPALRQALERLARRTSD